STTAFPVGVHTSLNSTDCTYAVLALGSLCSSGAAEEDRFPRRTRPRLVGASVRSLRSDRREGIARAPLPEYRSGTQRLQHSIESDLLRSHHSNFESVRPSICHRRIGSAVLESRTTRPRKQFTSLPARARTAANASGRRQMWPKGAKSFRRDGRPWRPR